MGTAVESVLHFNNFHKVDSICWLGTSLNKIVRGAGNAVTLFVSPATCNVYDEQAYRSCDTPPGR